MKTVKSLNDFLPVLLGTKPVRTLKETSETLDRVVYKGTNCGAWAKIVKKGKDYKVSVGSIVEGVDYGTNTYSLTTPFKSKDFWANLVMVEQEAKDIWDDTHGCPKCGSENPDTGCIAINPKCKSCKGEGIIR
jgi:hypothetical protein